MSEVSIVKCEDYQTEQVFKAIKRSVELLGGIECFVKKNQKVLIKPNLLKASAPAEAVTTHPEIIRAIIRLVKEQTDNIFVGDSPAGLIKAESVYEKSGIAGVCREEKVTLIKFDNFIEKDGFPFAKIKGEVDVCISAPKFKTHNLTTITAAVKNVFGFIPGLYKVHCHKSAPNYKTFSALVAKVYGLVRPQLNIIDAVWAMEGDGPSDGKPRKIGLILASSDGVALDSVLAKIIGLKPLAIASTREAFRLKLGEADLNKINVAGESLDKTEVKNFKLPRIISLYRIPNFIARYVFKLVPLIMGIDKKSCNGCLMCKNICPQNAIREIKGRLKIDFSRCILCLCCGEVCPNNAIYLRFLRRRIAS